jgi:hypothetical protein
MVYMVGVAAKSSLQMTSPQNLGSKGLTGVFWIFLLFSYRIVRLATRKLCIFPRFSFEFFLDFFLDFFLEKRWGFPAPLRFSRGCRQRCGMVPPFRLCAVGGKWYAKEAELAGLAS